MIRRLLPILAMAAAVPLFVESPHPRATLIFSEKGPMPRGELMPTMDGRRIYHMHDSTVVFVYDRATKRETKVLDDIRGPFGLAISNAGDRIAFVRGDAPAAARGYLWTIAIDPASGLPAGEARRVSLSPAAVPSFSPDGKQLAFSSRRTKADSDMVVIVPVGGGPERTIVQTGGQIWPLSWSDAGIFYSLSVASPEPSNPMHYRAAPVNGIYRIDPSGGTPKQVLRTADWGGYPGLSRDGKAIVSWEPTWDTLVVSDASGNRRLASYEPEPNAATPDVMLSATRGIGWQARAPRVAMVLDLATGASRVVSDTQPALLDVQWAGDSRSLVLARNRSAMVRVDPAGGTSRVLETERGISASFGHAVSPDGAYLVYHSAQDSGSLRVMDLRTGKRRLLARGAGLGPRPHWTSDSKAILYTAFDLAKRADTSRTMTVHEVDLSGRDRVLSTLTLPCGVASQCGVFVDDSLLLTWTAGAGPGATVPPHDRTEYQISNVRRKATRTVYTRAGAAQPVATASPNGKWIAIRQIPPDGGPASVVVMHPDGSARTIVPISFPSMPGMNNPSIASDGRTLLMASTEHGGSLYRIDVATAKAARITELDGILNQLNWLVSPDGKSVAYAKALAPYVDFYDFDLTETLRSGPARR